MKGVSVGAGVGALIVIALITFFIARPAEDSTAGKMATQVTDEHPTAAPEPSPPVATPVQVLDPCERARGWLEGTLSGVLDDAPPLAQASLSWDAGLTWAPSAEAPITEGAFHAKPVQGIPVGELTLRVAENERIQGAVALPGPQPQDVAVVLWAGVNVNADRVAPPELDDLESWDAYRDARLDLRIYRWSTDKQMYQPHQIFSGSPTCETPFKCGARPGVPEPKVAAVGAQALLVSGLRMEGCGDDSELCVPVRHAKLVMLKDDRVMGQSTEVALGRYTGSKPRDPLMRDRYFEFSLSFRDWNGDGELDFEYGGTAERLTAADDRGRRYLSHISRPINRAVMLRFLKGASGWTQVERAMSDLFVGSYNEAIKRALAERRMVASTFSAVERAAKVLAVITESLASGSDDPPTELTDPGLACLALAREEGASLCDLPAAGIVPKVDIDVIEDRALALVRVYKTIRDDSPTYSRDKLDKSLVQSFGWLCAAARTAHSP